MSSQTKNVTMIPFVRFFFILSLVTGIAFAQPEAPPLVELYGANGDTKSGALTTPQKVAYRVFHLEFKTPSEAKKLKVPGVTPFHRYGKFVDVFIEPKEQVMKSLSSSKGLVWAEPAGAVALPPPAKIQSARVRSLQEPEEIVRGGVNSSKGKGVIVAILDSGVDFTHPDFITMDKKGRPVSRFEYIWDTRGSRHPAGQSAPITYPDGQSCGTVYSRATLTAALRGELSLPELDGNGHGTSCAGIAAGNGRGMPSRKYSGVAPEATLVAVCLGDRLEHSFLFGAALDWLEKVAKKRSMVVSSSWGTEFHGHDGATLKERLINTRYPPKTKGRILLFASGNSGAERFHGATSFSDSSHPGSLTWFGRGEVKLYFDQNDTSLVLSPRTGKRRREYIHPLTGQKVWHFPAFRGAMNLKVHSGQGKQGRVDAYFAGDGGFTGASVAPSGTLSAPSTAESALSVGSYDFSNRFHQEGRLKVLGVGLQRLIPMNMGALSLYSGHGYTRDGRLKPDLVAPGQWFTAPAPLRIGKFARDTTKKYRLFNGTSAAAPYAAGVVALLLEKKPDLNLEKLRELLSEHLTEDEETGSLPNGQWGRGKLDLDAVKSLLRAR